MKKIYHALMLLIGCLLASCEHKELCFDHSPAMEVEVVFDWKNSPEAHPESMRLYLFPKEGGEPLLYEFPNKTGGIIKVQPGEYKALCYNSDTETIGFRNIESMETFEAYALKGILALGGSLAPRAEGTEKERPATGNALQRPKCGYYHKIRCRKTADCTLSEKGNMPL